MAESNKQIASSNAAMEANGFQFLSKQSDRFQLALANLASEHRQEVFMLQQEILKLSDQLRERERLKGTLNHIQAQQKETHMPPEPHKAIADNFEQLGLASDSIKTSSVIDTRNAFERVVHHPRFEFLLALVILFYTIVMALQMQYDGIERAYELDIERYDKPASKLFPHCESVLDAINFVINVFFCVEYVIRILAYRCRSWRSLWMWIDGTIVVTFLINQARIVELELAILRLLRLARLLRVVKEVGMAKYCHNLFILMRSVEVSTGALVWSFFLLLTVQLVTGLCIFQLITYAMNQGLSDDDSRELFQYFGTFTKTAFTMFELTHGNWGMIARTIERHMESQVLGEFLGFIIALYHCVLCFAFIKIIQAVFISSTTNALRHDEDVQNLKRQDEHEHAKRKFLEIFHMLDDNNDGYLEWDEFQNIVNDDILVTKFKTQEINPCDMERLFAYLDDGDGKIDISEFITGMLKATGEARCLEVLHVLGDLRKLAKKFDAFVSMSKQGEDNGPPISPVGDSLAKMQQRPPERFVPNEYVPIMEFGAPRSVSPKTPKVIPSSLIKS